MILSIHDSLRDKDNKNWVNLDGSAAPVAKYKWTSGRPDATDTKHCGLMYNGEIYDWGCDNSYGVRMLICAPSPSETS